MKEGHGEPPDDTAISSALFDLGVLPQANCGISEVAKHEKIVLC